MLRYSALAALLLLLLPYEATSQKCGFQSCPEPDPKMLNVHIIPHTHDDVGWLKTVDQYFYGSRSNIQQAGVQYILDSVITELAKNPNRKFTYVEMAFFTRWWNQQSNETQALVKRLVSNGQLHFTIGGWCMADEAATHYVSLIDQHTLGFRFLSDNFGECGRPLAAWQIDPFGHSREVASLFAQFGFNGLYLGRIDYQDKDIRRTTKQLEFVWKGSDDLESLHGQGISGDFDMFTGITYDGYGPPGGFCWDEDCGDEPVMDDPRLHDYNADERAAQFVDTARSMASVYNSNNLMLTFGMDFWWENAVKWYVNLDKLIKYVNLKSNQTGVQVFYSTPACYSYAVNKAGLKYKVKTDDFFPYAHIPHAYWTGYFTSRPAFKDLVRTTESYLQSFRHLHLFAQLGNINGAADSLFTLSEAMGLAQHHDAVSGTEKQQVAYDYAERIQAGLDACFGNLLQGAYGKLLPLNSGYKAPSQQFCAYLNVSSCDVSSAKQAFTVTVYNPYAQPNEVWLHLPVSGAVTVTSPTGATVTSKLVSTSDSTRRIWTYMTNGHIPVTAVDNEVVFRAELPPLGWSTYFVWPSSTQSPMQAEPEAEAQSLDTSDSMVEDDESFEEELFRFANEIPEVVQPKGPSARQKRAAQEPSKPASSSGSGTFENLRTNGVNNFILRNSHLVLHFDTQSGLLQEVDNLDIEATLPLTPSLKYYIAADKNVASGAYMFRPMDGTSIMNFSNPSVSYVQGSVVQEVRQTFGSWANVVTRLYDDANYIELEWTVGPIDVSDQLGREVVMMYETGLNNGGACWTDANGRQLMKRVLNYRPTWNITMTENVSSNYYPINSRILLRDYQEQYQLTVLTDRSAGGGCVRPGSVEIMVHRRLLHDDGFVGEPLNEPGLDGNGLIVRGRHFILFDTVARSAALHRDLAMRVFNKPLVTLSPNTLDYNTYAARYRTQWSGLASLLPPNVHLLTLADWLNATSAVRQVLVRFEHIYQKNEDSSLSQPATFNLQRVFANFTITSFETLALGANLKASDLQRLNWNVETQTSSDATSKSGDFGFDHGFGFGARSKHSRPLKYNSKSEKEKLKDDWTITLQPMEIRTLLLNLA